MSSGPRHGMLGGRPWLVALSAGVLAAGLATPSAALASARHEHVTGSVRAWHPARQQAPDQVIDAQKDPQKAGQLLNSGCANLSNCSWKSDTSITTGYGPPHVLGDALYNCSDPDNEQAYSETAVGISESREESTSISESLSVEVGVGIADVEAEAVSKQLESFSTEVSTTSAVAVPPGWKGWNETKVLTAFVTGSAYVTDGIHLIQVKNIQLDFPGYQDPNDLTDSPVLYIGYKTPMTADDIASRCNAISGLGAVRSAPPPTHVKQLAQPKGSLKLTLCQPRGRCQTRQVTGTKPAGIDRATATLTQADRTYATGTDTRGLIRLTVQRPIKRGTYTLTIRQLPGSSRNGHRRAQTILNTIVPIAIR